jgi:hypothetical protein
MQQMKYRANKKIQTLRCLPLLLPFFYCLCNWQDSSAPRARSVQNQKLREGQVGEMKLYTIKIRVLLSIFVTREIYVSICSEHWSTSSATLDTFAGRYIPFNNVKYTVSTHCYIIFLLR